MLALRLGRAWSGKDHVLQLEGIMRLITPKGVKPEGVTWHRRLVFPMR